MRCCAVAVILLAAWSSAMAADELDAIKAGLTSSKATEREAAAKAAAKLGEQSKPIARQLCGAMFDKSPKVSTAARESLRAVWPDLQSNAVTVVLDKNPQSVARAIKALDEIGEPAIPAMLAAVAVRGSEMTPRGARRTPEYYYDLLQTTWKVGKGDSAVFTAFVTLASDREHGAIAIEKLSEHAELHPESRKQLLTVFVRYLKAGNDRVAAIKAIGRLGADGKDAIPVIKPFASDPAQGVRSAAEEALKKIAASN